MATRGRGRGRNVRVEEQDPIQRVADIMAQNIQYMQTMQNMQQPQPQPPPVVVVPRETTFKEFKQAGPPEFSGMGPTIEA